jgi:pyrroline-5-carboxylate reductase
MLEEGGLRTTLIRAVEAATQRSKELGEMMTKNFANNNH